MKRYEATMTYAEYTVEPEAAMVQDEHGQYVKAEVAQALYDALAELMRAQGGANKNCGHDFDCICPFDMARSALSLADGNGEE